MSEAAKETPVPAAAGSGTSPAKTFHCSFCFKSQHQVKRLVAGPGGIFICDECGDLCNEWVAGRRPDLPKAPWAEELPTERLLKRLRPIMETVQGKGNQLQWTVELLRSRRVSWTQIGAALGISRQSAWERFT